MQSTLKENEFDNVMESLATDEYYNFIVEESKDSAKGNRNRNIVDLLEGLDESKIQAGQVFKNYKEMCRELNIAHKSTTTKTKQMKELETYYFDYKQEGHKIKITKVHNLNDIQKKTRTLRVSYKDYIEELIINIMIDDVKGRAKSGNSNKEGMYDELILSQGQLAKAVGMVNKNYGNCMSKTGSYSYVAGYDKAIVDDWSDSFQRFLKRSIQGAIESLRDRRLIIYEMRVSVCEYNIDDFQRVVDKDGDEYLGFYTNRRSINIRLATAEEKVKISQIEREVLNGFQVSNLRELFEEYGMNGFYSYKEKVNKRLTSELGIQNYFLSYALSFSDDIITQYAEAKDIDFGLTTRAKNEYATQMNKMIMDKVNGNAIRRHNKAKEMKDTGNSLKPIQLIRLDDNYIETCENITKDVIDKGCKKNYYNSIKNRKSLLDAQRERLNTSQ